MGDKEKLPLISIIIPTYGRAEMLSRAIDSVLNQTYKNIEVIVINDNFLNSNSFKETLRELEKYGKINKVKIYSDGINRGGGLARNKGIELSCGEYITFLDDDDYYYPNKIEKQIEHILNEKIDVSICDMEVRNQKGELSYRIKGESCVGDLSNFLVNGITYTPMILCKKTVLLDINMFTDIPRFQDHILMIKILKKKYKVFQLREKLFVHVDHKGDRLTFSEKTKLAFNIRRNIEKKLLNTLAPNQKKKYEMDNLKIDLLYFYDELKFEDLFKRFLKVIFETKDIKQILVLNKIFFKYVVKKASRGSR